MARHTGLRIQSGGFASQAGQNQSESRAPGRTATKTIRTTGMPLDITFTLSDQDLEHFQKIVDRAKSAMSDGSKPGEVEKAARKLIEEARGQDLPDFIASRLIKLETIINMVADEEWKLSDDERNRVLGALVYFTDPEDLIPDSVGKCELVSYCTIIVVVTGGDNAVGLSTDSQTNAVAV
jgi:hypothetical protein